MAVSQIQHTLIRLRRLAGSQPGHHRRIVLRCIHLMTYWRKPNKTTVTSGCFSSSFSEITGICSCFACMDISAHQIYPQHSLVHHHRSLTRLLIWSVSETNMFIEDESEGDAKNSFRSTYSRYDRHVQFFGSSLLSLQSMKPSQNRPLGTHLPLRHFSSLAAHFPFSRHRSIDSSLPAILQPIESKSRVQSSRQWEKMSIYRISTVMTIPFPIADAVIRNAFAQWASVTVTFNVVLRIRTEGPI